MQHQSNLDDFHQEPQSEQTRRRRGRRKERAVTLAWGYLLAHGDKANGYRAPLTELALTLADDLGVHEDTAASYLRTSSTWSQLSPFERLSVDGAIYIRPKPGGALKKRLQEHNGKGRSRA